MLLTPELARAPRVGVVGGGILGLTLALRLAKLGLRVELFEAAPELGGLASSHDYGSFKWDRFYHCILPQDRRLIALLRDLGLQDDLIWTRTLTGYYGAGKSHSMSTTADYLRFPLLSFLDKVRIGATVVYAALAANPMDLHRITAEQWLRRWCGRRGYEVFWQPLLKAKFGPYHDQVAAVFLWATLTRLFGARSGAASKEKLGYVSGGYDKVISRFERELAARGAHVHKGTPVTAIRRVEGATGRPPRSQISYGKEGLPRIATFDRVFFTGPTHVARKVVDSSLEPFVTRAEHDHPSAKVYLGVACMVVALRRQVSPFYLLNVGDTNVELTGVIEMTNLVDRHRETNGLSLVYVPQYMDSNDPRQDEDDAALSRALLDRGLFRIRPDLAGEPLVYRGVHRARFVQPLPLVVHDPPSTPAHVPLTDSFQVLNTSMLRCATLNNDEVVGFVDRFVAANAKELTASRDDFQARGPGDSPGTSARAS